MEVSHRHVRPGMPVITTDARQIGKVKEVRETDFLIDRPMQRDAYVPFAAVQAVTDDGVILSLSADESDEANWPNP
jgi:sporulation protein YlmC with PRC-barrel domain